MHLAVQSALSSAFMVKNAFKITLIVAGVLFGPSALFALFFAYNGTSFESAKCNKMELFWGGQPFCSYIPAICAKNMGFMRNFAIFLTNKNIIPKISKNGQKNGFNNDKTMIRQYSVRK